MTEMIVVVVWGLSHVMQGVFACAVFRAAPESETRRRTVALKISLLASIVPLGLLITYLRVFVIGGGSSVAQFAGEEGMHLWMLWADSWQFFFFAVPLTFLITAILACQPPYPPRHWASFMSRLCAVGATVCAWYPIVKRFPDA